jgi:tetratricopeptide (TPR) repeat protein
MSAQALLIDILPAEIKKLVDNKEFLQALVLAKQNRDLFKNNWLDSTFLVDIAEAYNKIGIFDEAQKLYLYLIEISGADEREEFYLPMIQATFDHGNYILAEDYAAQYVYNYPNGRFVDEIFLLRLQSLVADERLDEARRLLPDQIPEQTGFLAFAASLAFRLDDYPKCLAALETLLAQGVQFDEGQQFAYAESLYQTGRWEEAADAFRSISDQHSFYDQSLYRQAELARKAGQDKKALRFLQDIVEKGTRSLWKEFAERELQFLEVARRM